MAPAAHELQAHTDTVSKRQRLRMGMSQRAQNKAKAAAAAASSAGAGAGGGHQTAKQAKYAAVAGNVYWVGDIALPLSLCVCSDMLPTPPSAAKAASAKKVVKDQIQKQVTPHESRSHSSRFSTGGKPCPCASCVCVCVRQRNERQAMKMMKGESLKAYNRRLRRMTDTKLQQVDKTMPLRKVNEKRKR